MRRLALLVLLGIAGCGSDHPDACSGDRCSTLTVSRDGDGTITAASAGIDCGAACTASVPRGTPVTLTATPGEGMTLLGWTGACAGSEPECTIAVTEDTVVGALFGIGCADECAPGSAVCVDGHAEQRCGEHDNDACLELGPATACGASELCAADRCGPAYTLTVDKAGPGSGVVTSATAGIDCGATCTAQATPGSVIMLSASPLPGAMFAGWSGACTGMGACTVTLDADRAVTATFVGACSDECSTGATSCATTTSERTCGNFDGDVCLEWSTPMSCAATELCANNACTPAPLLTVTRAGAGTGTVSSTPVGISCGTDCSERYVMGTMVTLAAAPSGGGTFAGWSGGGCSGTGPCAVTMTAATTVSASFDPACSDQCTAGASRCAGAGQTQVCGNYDGDACLEWSASIACSSGRACLTTTCEPGFVVSSSATGPASEIRVNGSYCGYSSCQTAHAEGTSATVTIAPQVDAIFNGWSGACTGTGACTLMTTASVTGAFAYRCVYTPLEQLASGASGYSAERQLALDDTYVYWTNLDASTVKRVAKTGGAVQTLAAGQSGASGIGVDSTHVYWTQVFGDRVLRMPVGGGTIETIATAQDGATALALDGTHVYWANLVAGTIMRWPKAGGTPTPIATGQPLGNAIQPAMIAVDATHVYWTNRGDGTIVKVPLAGGTVVPLASGQSDPAGIALDGTHVYWTNSNNRTIARVAKAGGMAEVLASNSGAGSSGIAVSGGSVYWVNDGYIQNVYTVPVTGGMPVALKAGISGGWGIALDAAYVYFGGFDYAGGFLSRLTRSATCAP
ncbi:MAG TPA: hypothetical protein VNO30_14260 [Kofleriaceae bacterium]|nr:hypothetical protein [Kofleriaceae bacterium]